MRRGYGWCCECGNPRCNIGPFTRPCGEGPYGGPDPYEMRWPAPPVGYRVQSIKQSVNYWVDESSAIEPMMLDVDRWQLVNRSFNIETRMTLELWRNESDGRMYQRPLDDWEPWSPPKFDDAIDASRYLPPISPPKVEPAPVSKTVAARDLTTDETEALEAALAEYEAAKLLT